ncbi:MAG: hypothetical protein C4290_03515 [Chloroflexota bacterium]
MWMAALPLWARRLMVDEPLTVMSTRAPMTVIAIDSTVDRATLLHADRGARADAELSSVCDRGEEEEMQPVTIPYGDTTIDVELPDRARVIRRTTEPPPPLPDQERAIREAVAHPIGIRPIPELVRPGARVLIAFDAGPHPRPGHRGRAGRAAARRCLGGPRDAGLRQRPPPQVQARGAGGGAGPGAGGTLR